MQRKQTGLDSAGNSGCHWKLLCRKHNGKKRQNQLSLDVRRLSHKYSLQLFEALLWPVQEMKFSGCKLESFSAK